MWMEPVQNAWANRTFPVWNFQCNVAVQQSGAVMYPTIISFRGIVPGSIMARPAHMLPWMGVDNAVFCQSPQQILWQLRQQF